MAVKFAYHATRADEQQLEGGLIPMRGSINSRDLPRIFFCDNVRDALFWISERPDSVLIRFPWPEDASRHGSDYVSEKPVPGGEIELYIGDLLNPILRASNLGWDDREKALQKALTRGVDQKIQNSHMWVRIVQSKT